VRRSKDHNLIACFQRFMSRIHRLPPELANQIAAGEVVERPASVVKELVENAIDAGARRITIEIELGGKRLIRVEDDGIGMDGADALLALERHATSKVRRAEDLAAIRTLGFRGEALPSAASVSHLTLRTRTREAPAGIEIRVDAGVMVSRREVGTPQGTIVEVRDLFYNLPARRKFLKADSAEAGQVTRLVTQLALAYPEVGVVLISAGRRVLETPPVSLLRDRFYQLYGDRSDLIDVSREAAGIRLVGLIAPLGDGGPVRGPQNIFVNRRIVRDKTIAHAILAAYSVATIKERSPEVHLFLELPAERVDVNVHPTKAEVRFLEQSVVHEVLRRALADALGTTETRAFQLRPSMSQEVGGASASPVLLPGVLHGPSAHRSDQLESWRNDSAPLGGSPAVAGAQTTERSAAGMSSPSGAVSDPPAFASDLARSATPGVPASTAMAGAGLVLPGSLAGQEMVDAVRPMAPLGQFRHTYIIAVDAEGICIIDQHVAHERVLFEQTMERLTAGSLPSQRLLQPLLIDVAPPQRDALRAHAGELERLGFEIEEFGGSSVRVSALPAVLGIDVAAAAVRAVAGDLEELDRATGVEAALRRLAATMACHAAVKANQPLPVEKMIFILEELRRTAYSSVCPHGRPVVLRLTRREIERNFQRI
jgi:DNA mismatch repair protein MutL